MTQIEKTEAELINTFRDDQPANSITASDVRDLIISQKFIGISGWQFFFDSQYSSSSPRILTAGVRTQLTNNGLAETSGDPVTVPSGWDTASNIIVPGVLNSFGIVRVAFSGYLNAGSTSTFDIEIDVGSIGSPSFSNVIFRQTASLLKGVGPGNPQSFNFIMPFFVGPDFETNGGRIYITPIDDISLFDHATTLIQVYKPNPAGFDPVV